MTVSGTLITDSNNSWFVIDNNNLGYSTPIHTDDYKLCKAGLEVNFYIETIATGSGEFDIIDMDVARIQIQKGAPKYQYGMLITKPWSTEMYDHNDRVAEIVKGNIRKALAAAMVSWPGDPEDICPQGTDLYTIAKELCGSGWLQYSAEDIYKEACNELDCVQNYWLNDIYPYYVAWGFCKPVNPFFVGY